MKKNLFVVILALVLALCMTSIAVFAAPAETDVAKIGETGYATVKAAVEAATDGQTVVILKDATVEQFRIDGKSITLDLNGHKLSGTSVANQFTDVVPASQEYNLIAIAAGAGLTVKDSVTGGVLEINPTAGDDNAHIGVKGTFTLESGKVMANGGGYYGNLIYADGGKVNVNGGELTVVGNGDTRKDTTISAENNSTVTITNGVVSNSDHGYTLDIDSSVLTISGGTVEQTGTGYYMIETVSSTVSITNGTFNQKGTGYLAEFDKAVSATISGGTFTHTSTKNRMLKGYKGNYTITGGTFTDNGTEGIVDSKAIVSGGKFNKPIPVDACAPTLMPDATPIDGYYTVREITPEDICVELSYTENGVKKTQGFISLGAALDAARKVTDSIVTVSKNYTDVNGSFDAYDATQLVIPAGITLTCDSISVSGGSATGVTLLNQGTIHCDYIGGSWSTATMDNQGEIFCNYINAETDGWTNSGKIHLGQKNTATASTFENFNNTGVIDGTEGTTFTVNGTALVIDGVNYTGFYKFTSGKWIASGCVVALKNGATLATYDSLGDAYYFAEASGADTLKLVADTNTLLSNVDIKITLDLNGHTITYGNSYDSGILNVKAGGDLTVIDSSADQAGKIVATYGYAAVFVRDNATFTLESGTLIGNDDRPTVTIAKKYRLDKPAADVGATGAVVNINGGTIKNANATGNGIMILGTGTSKNYQATDPVLNINGGTITGTQHAAVIGHGNYGNTKINITGGTITSTQSTAIYHPQFGEMTITGGTITGALGVGVKGGDVTIGGTAVINGTGVKDYPTAGSGSGTAITGDAFYVEDNYKRGVTVTITGGTFTSTNAAAVNKLFSSTNPAKIEISGGTFSSDPSAYVAGNIVVTDNKNGTWTVGVKVDVNFKGASVTLDEKVGVNFTVDVGSASPADYMLFTLADGTQQKVVVGDLTPNAQNLYVFTCDTVAKQMNDTITATFYKDGVAQPAKEYSVRQYAEIILNPEKGFDENTKTMVKTMLNYGAEAQKYFKHNADNLVNAGLDTGAVSNDATRFDAFTYSAPVTTVTGITPVSAALNLESAVGLKFYFNLTAGNMSDYTFQYTKQGVVGTYDLKPFMENGKVCVEIPGLYAVNFNEKYDLTVSKGDESLTVTYGVYYYAKQAMASSSTTGIKDLVCAMADYCGAADAMPKA